MTDEPARIADRLTIRWSSPHARFSIDRSIAKRRARLDFRKMEIESMTHNEPYPRVQARQLYSVEPEKQTWWMQQSVKLTSEHGRFDPCFRHTLT